MNVKLENKRFLKINEIYAFIATEDGGEGIVGAKMPGTDLMLPFIGADLERVESLKKIADALGIKYEIVYFKREGYEH